MTFSEYKVRLSTVNDCALFVSKCCEYEYDIDLSFGKYTVDAKSIMGVLSIGSDKPCIVTIHCDDVDVRNKFEGDIKLWRM